LRGVLGFDVPACERSGRARKVIRVRRIDLVVERFGIYAVPGSGN
jgi:hypothetical protein